MELIPRQGAPDQVQVALVLELDLGDAVAADSGRADLLLGGAGLAPQGPQRWPRAASTSRPVGAVDADQARGELQVELVLVHPEVPQVQAGQQHGVASPGGVAPGGLDGGSDVRVPEPSTAVAVQAGQVLAVEIAVPLAAEGRPWSAARRAWSVESELGLELEEEGRRSPPPGRRACRGGGTPRGRRSPGTGGPPPRRERRRPAPARAPAARPARGPRRRRTPG